MSEKNRDSKNRWRNVTIAFRMSPEEDAELDLRVKLCGYQTRQEYIIESVLHQKVTAVGNPLMLVQFRKQLKGIEEELKRLTTLEDADEELFTPIRTMLEGFLGVGVDMHRANEIRPLMKRISVLAEKYQCAIILIGHMNKNSNGKSSYRGLGSIDFQAAARSVLIVGRVKDEPEIRVICHVKSSLAPEGDAIAFRLDKEKGFHWIGKYDISVEDLLSGDGRGQKIRSAKEFLKEILANGSMEQAKIAEEAEERGIKKKTLWNAKKELQIDSVKIGNKWFWMLQDE